MLKMVASRSFPKKIVPPFAAISTCGKAGFALDGSRVSRISEYPNTKLFEALPKWLFNSATVELVRFTCLKSIEPKRKLDASRSKFVASEAT